MIVKVWEWDKPTQRTFTTEDERWLEYKSHTSGDGILYVSKLLYDELLPSYREALTEVG